MSKETREAALGLRVGTADLFAYHRNGRRVPEAPQPGIHGGLHPKLNGLGRLVAPKGRSKIDKALEVVVEEANEVKLHGNGHLRRVTRRQHHLLRKPSRDGFRLLQQKRPVHLCEAGIQAVRLRIGGP